jgi:hypothetical protein
MALQGDEMGFYNVMEVFVMVWGGDGVVNGHEEQFDWVINM